MSRFVTQGDICDRDGFVKRVPVIVCTDTRSFTGFAHATYGQRLLDALNEGRCIGQGKALQDFLPLTDVAVLTRDGSKETAASVYVKKCNILFVAEMAIEPGRDSEIGISRCGLLVEKEAIEVEVGFPSYTLLGRMHKSFWEELLEAIEGDAQFLPLTNVTVSPGLIGGDSSYDFVALNKERITHIALLGGGQ